ncbi:MAG: hypothetical protein ACRDSS_13405, partial [Actinocrinis sp.]
MIDTGHRTDPLTRAVAQLAGAFRALPQSKLLGPVTDGRSRAEAGHRFAALLAAFAQGVEERESRIPPAWRKLPFDGVFIVGDQIAVTGYDLVTGLRALGDLDGPVWSADRRRVRAQELVDVAMREADGLR